MKERLFGDASWGEIILVGSIVSIYAIMAWSIVTNYDDSINFFTKPLLEITISELAVIILVIGWLIKKL